MEKTTGNSTLSYSPGICPLLVFLTHRVLLALDSSLDISYRLPIMLRGNYHVISPLLVLPHFLGNNCFCDHDCTNIVYYEANECVLMTYAFLHNLFLFFLGLIIASNFHLFSFLSTPKSSHMFPQLCKALLNHISTSASLGDIPLTSRPRPHDSRCPSWSPLTP